jgi:hypothetical protein
LRQVLRHAPCDIAFGRLYLDDLGAEIGEQHAQ